MRPYTSSADERLRDRFARWAREAADGLDPETAGDAAIVEFVRAMGRERLLQWLVPKAHGGRDRTVRALPIVVAREEIAAKSSLLDTMFAMQGLGSYPITLAGNPRIQRRFLPEVARGKLVAAFALTEDDAGSDAAALVTEARRDGAGYRLNGRKRFISNAGIADFYVVFAKTDAAAGARGVSAFLVEASNPGLTVTERTRLNAPHPIGKLHFDDCKVEAGARLGAEGDGLKLALRTLDTFRATVGAAACGLARCALTETIARVQARHQFGRPLAQFQATRMRVATMATRLEAARGLVYRAAWIHDQGEPPTLSAAMAKLAATEAAFRIVDDAVQLHGGDGVVHGEVVERLYREVRALRIYEGTSEIQQLVIARALLDG